MTDDTITKLPAPSGISPDPLTDVIRDGARKLIEQAIEAELAALPGAFADQKLEDGRARLVRHGHLPEREIMTGIGPVAVKVARVRDRTPGADKISFTPSILPRYLRKAKSVEELLPWLYLKGVSTGDFSEALAALLGPHAKGLSAKTITRLKADWWADYEAWQKRDLGTRRFLYIWAVAHWAWTNGAFNGRPSTSSRGWPRKNNAFWWSWARTNTAIRSFWP